jgi:hypothetical protein
MQAPSNIHTELNTPSLSKQHAHVGLAWYSMLGF